MHGKLTKGFLMGLSQDLYITSNIFNVETGRPSYEGPVIAKWARERQWEKIKKSGANGLLCYVFPNKDAANKYLEKIF